VKTVIVGDPPVEIVASPLLGVTTADLVAAIDWPG